MPYDATNANLYTCAMRTITIQVDRSAMQSQCEEYTSIAHINAMQCSQNTTQTPRMLER